MSTKGNSKQTKKSSPKQVEKANHEVPHHIEIQDPIAVHPLIKKMYQTIIALQEAAARDEGEIKHLDGQLREAWEIINTQVARISQLEERLLIVEEKASANESHGKRLSNTVKEGAKYLQEQESKPNGGAVFNGCTFNSVNAGGEQSGSEMATMLAALNGNSYGSGKIQALPSSQKKKTAQIGYTTTDGEKLSF